MVFCLQMVVLLLSYFFKLVHTCLVCDSTEGSNTHTAAVSTTARRPVQAYNPGQLLQSKPFLV